MELTAVVLGGTGLIGAQVVNLLLQDSDFTEVKMLVRRPVTLSHPKLRVLQVDFESMAEYREKIGTGNCIFCAIGTTQQKVKGNKNEYRKIDFDIPVHGAQLGRDAGFHTFVVVSSSGAGAARSNFYLKLKGQMEDAIAAVGYPALHIFRPSMLLGKREEFRLAELAVKWMMPFFNFFMFGSLRNYKGIQSSVVAQAMVNAAKARGVGKKIYHYDEIKQLASK